MDDKANADQALASTGGHATATGASVSKDNEVNQRGPLAGDAARAPSTARDTRNPEQVEKDRELERNRGDGANVNNPRAPEAVARQHQQVDEALQKRSDENEEGHAKNLERAENEAREAHARTERADHHLANHVPTGKQDNRNTPRVLKDGTKVWDK